MTEDEAKTKWCPMVRKPYFTDDDGIAAVNKTAMEYAPSLSSDGNYDIPINSFCIGSRCMMWRETSHKIEQKFLFPDNMLISDFIHQNPYEKQKDVQVRCGLRIVKKVYDDYVSEYRSFLEIQFQTMADLRHELRNINSANCSWLLRIPNVGRVGLLNAYNFVHQRTGEKIESRSGYCGLAGKPAGKP